MTTRLGTDGQEKGAAVSCNAETYRRWFDFEKDVHRKVLAALSAVPPDKRAAPEFRKAVDLAAHIVGTRWFWLERIGATSERPLKMFTKDFPVADLPTRLSEMDAAWDGYLGRLSEGELSRAVEWGRAEGPRFSNTVEDLLTQLFGHSTYHRGQIALLLRQLGCEPPETEFLFWARKPAGVNPPHFL